MEKCSFCGQPAKWKSHRKGIYVYMCNEDFHVHSINYDNYEVIKRG